jgi:hypothetical protein
MRESRMLVIFFITIRSQVFECIVIFRGSLKTHLRGWFDVLKAEIECACLVWCIGKPDTAGDDVAIFKFIDIVAAVIGSKAEAYLFLQEGLGDGQPSSNPFLPAGGIEVSVVIQ